MTKIPGKVKVEAAGEEAEVDVNGGDEVILKYLLDRWILSHYWLSPTPQTPPTPTYTHSVHVSSTSNHWQGHSPNLRRPWDQVMLCKRIRGNWILLASAQEFSLQWSWVWCARNASSIGRRGIHRGAVHGSGGQGGGLWWRWWWLFGVTFLSNPLPCLMSPLLWFNFFTWGLLKPYTPHFTPPTAPSSN